MLNLVHIKNDFKLLKRDSIMLALFLSPLLIVLVFKLILIFLVPLSQRYITYELPDYGVYILSLCFVLTPGILGIVIGFMLLDDRDGNIAELMSITPMGRIGYLLHRFTFSFIATVIYSLVGYFTLSIIHLNPIPLILLSILMGIYSVIIGIIVSIIATDKVKGLTYAKALNILMLFIFTDLLSLPWLSTLSKAVPTYWVPKIIEAPSHLGSWGAALLIHFIYLAILLRFEFTRKISL